MRVVHGRTGGFTLLELVVALAVIAVVMAALHGTGQTALRGGAYLEEKTLAHWVAANELARLRLLPTWPELGIREGRTGMAQRDWHWRATIMPTPEPAVRRVELSVALVSGNDQIPRASLTGFVTR